MKIGRDVRADRQAAVFLVYYAILTCSENATQMVNYYVFYNNIEL